MIDIKNLGPGEYALGVRTSERSHPFGTIWIWPRSSRSPNPSPGLLGQWFLELRTSALEATGLPAAEWAELLGRLGLHPIDIGQPLLEDLRSQKPIAIVADTSALHSGAALQVCGLRDGRPTHFAVPDQTYMEIHSQREDKTLGNKASQRVRTNLAMFMAVRHLRRLRAAGHVIHFARPPEAMVRYLGAERGGAVADEDPQASGPAKAPSYVRDRLVIEAARACHRAAPELPLYLLTTDVKLALQAEVEQFNSALCRVPNLPSVPRYGSPWISPYTLQMLHLPVDELLAELSWTLGHVYLQQKGAADAISWQLPAQKEAARLLLQGKHLEATTFRLPREAAAADVPPEVPKKPPSAAALMEALLKLTSGVGKTLTLGDEGPFLVAFEWALRQGDHYTATPAGMVAGNKWRSLTVDDVLGWCDWMDATAASALGVTTIRDALSAISARGPGQARDTDVQRKLMVGQETARKFVVFASGFGAFIRIDGKLWAPQKVADPEGAVLDAIQRVAARSGASAAPAERVFTDLLSQAALPFHVFRRAIYRLVEKGTIERDRGTVTRPPKTGESHVRQRVLVPDGKGGVVFREVDLGEGDFLIPGTTMQDLVLRGESA